MSARVIIAERTRPRRTPGSLAALGSGRILVPIDFSGKSRQALEVAVPLAELYQARVFLVHVVRPPQASGWRIIPGGKHYLMMEMNNIAEGARKKLAALAAKKIPAPISGRTLVRRGNPYQEIISAARQLRADLIVISTHGYSGLKRMLIGSVTERVVRHAPCTVLTVRRH